MAINHLSAASPLMVKLLQQLVLVCLSLNAWMVASHIPGVCNNIADSFYCLQWERIQQLTPEMDEKGTECPWHLWDLLEGL